MYQRSASSLKDIVNIGEKLIASYTLISDYSQPGFCFTFGLLMISPLIIGKR